MPLNLIYKKTIDFLIPPHCVLCQGILETDQGLCGACWKKINFISNPFCQTCGLPLPFETQESQNINCGPCSLEPPIFDQARSAVIYDTCSKDLILRFKHGDHTSLTPFFTKWLLSTGQGFLNQADYILPVPLHWTRLLKRRYNQAALLAKALGHQSAVTYLPSALKRIRATAPQGHMGKEERAQNVANSFVLSKTYANILKGKAVILVDDVFTSGATLDACTKALKRGGVQKVYALTLARVARI